MTERDESLRAEFRVARGEAQIACRLEVRPGRALALLGLNGSGKSTILHAISGLLSIADGEIALGPELLDAPARGLFVPAEARGFGYVFQNARLFPHLDVLENVAYGLRARGLARRDARKSAHAALERVGASKLSAQRGSALSGGEAQRVALARALAISPRVLLLDEALAAVDSHGRAELRASLRSTLEDFEGVALIVTHDVVDAFTLATEVAVLEGHRVVQTGPVQDVCSAPSSRYVADMIGLNFYRGIAREGCIELEGGGKIACASRSEGAVIAQIHPRAVSIYAKEPHGSPRNVWSVEVLGIESSPERARVRLRGALTIVAEVTPAAVRDLQLREGAPAWVSVKATEVRVHSA